MNDFLVSLAAHQRVVILNQTRLHAPMTPDEALSLAAWLVAIAEPFATKPFAEFLEEAQS